LHDVLSASLVNYWLFTVADCMIFFYSEINTNVRYVPMNRITSSLQFFNVIMQVL